VQLGQGTPDDDDITGTAGNDALYGNGGWDLIEGAGGNDLLDGGSGTDTAWYEGNLADYDVIVAGHRLFVTDTVGLDGADTLVNVERLDFADVALAFDVDGSAGEAYRMYQAAFDRAPDEAGLGLWIAYLDAGVSVRDVAQGFANSDEFRALYGSNTDYTTLVTGLYQNGLNRTPDAVELRYWVEILASGRDSVAGVLAAFSESQENYDQLIGVMQDGMAYQVWA
jgi:serralysin